MRSATERRVAPGRLIRRFTRLYGSMVARMMTAGICAWRGMATCRRRHRAARHDAEETRYPAHIALLNRRAAGCRYVSNSDATTLA
jgi:hypothetical protein